jgi:hypothetical protein
MGYLRFDTDDGTLASIPAILAESEPDAFNQAEHDFIQRSRLTALSFFQVHATSSGKTLTVRDLLVDDEFVVAERSASQSLHAGDLFFGSVQVLVGVNMFLALAVSRIPPLRVLPIADLREVLEGLLVEFERAGSGDDLMAPPVDWLRAELKMPRR